MPHVKGGQKKLTTRDHRQTAPLSIKNDSSLVSIFSFVFYQKYLKGIFYGRITMKNQKHLKIIMKSKKLKKNSNAQHTENAKEVTLMALNS